MALLQFTIDDMSPAITYSPFPDTFGSADLTAGWNPYFTNSAFVTSHAQLGNGTSLHITSLDGAALAVRWFGTGIQLYGNITHDANYSIFIDGTQTPVNTTTSSVSDGLLFSQLELPQSNHLLSMTIDIGPVPGQPMNTSMLVFDYAFVQSSWQNNTQPTNQTLPDILIDFHGNWTNGTDSSSRASQKQGDTAHIQFLGQAFFLSGTTSPSAGNYSVALDNSSEPIIYSAKSSFTVPNALLFYATGLQENVTHDVLVRNEGGGTLEVANGGWSVFADGSSLATSTSPSDAGTGSGADKRKGPTIGISIGAICGFLIMVATAFLLYKRRNNASNSEGDPEPFFSTRQGNINVVHNPMHVPPQPKPPIIEMDAGLNTESDATDEKRPPSTISALRGFLIMVGTAFKFAYKRRKNISNSEQYPEPFFSTRQGNINVVHNPMHVQPQPKLPMIEIGANVNITELDATGENIQPSIAAAAAVAPPPVETAELLEELDMLRRRLAEVMGTVAGDTPPPTYYENDNEIVD
ncbi:hypothetical protein BDQ17DRAFT_1287786 [Cyathus striatus]|nr:hypothetical protein BDQ17DRAFT_1287786 [Cyathus striatus]